MCFRMDEAGLDSSTLCVKRARSLASNENSDGFLSLRFYPDARFSDNDKTLAPHCACISIDVFSFDVACSSRHPLHEVEAFFS